MTAIGIGPTNPRHRHRDQPQQKASLYLKSRKRFNLPTSPQLTLPLLEVSMVWLHGHLKPRDNLLARKVTDNSLYPKIPWCHHPEPRLIRRSGTNKYTAAHLVWRCQTREFLLQLCGLE